MISKLREYNKYVIVVGEKATTSELLVGYCDELVYLQTITGETVDVPLEAAKASKGVERPIAAGLELNPAYKLLARAVNIAEDQRGVAKGSQVKSLMKQLDSTFNERTYGFQQFKQFVMQAEADEWVHVTIVCHESERAREYTRGSVPHVHSSALESTGSDGRLYDHALGQEAPVPSEAKEDHGRAARAPTSPSGAARTSLLHS